MSRALIEQLLAEDLREVIGDFHLPRRSDSAAALLGRRAHRWKET